MFYEDEEKESPNDGWVEIISFEEEENEDIHNYDFWLDIMKTDSFCEYAINKKNLEDYIIQKNGKWLYK